MSLNRLYDEMEYHIPVYGQYKFYQMTETKEFESRPLLEQIGVVSLHSATTAAGMIILDQARGGGAREFASLRHAFHPAVVLGSMFGMIAQANFSLIRRAPEEMQQGMWQMFSSGLTGTFGIGNALNL